MSLNAGQITYVAGSGFQYLRPGESATDHFTYTVSDGHGGTATGQVDVLVSGANDAPTAGDESAFVNSGSSVKIAVLANDSDPEGDLLGLVSATAPAPGSATLNADGTITYAPSAGYSGTDSLTLVGVALADLHADDFAFSWSGAAWARSRGLRPWAHPGPGPPACRRWRAARH